MNDTRKGGVKALLFIFFLSLLTVGGYILTYELTKKETKTSLSELKDENKKFENLKIDPENEYIYYEDVNTISKEHDITYQRVILNINSPDAKNLQSTLNNATEEIESSLKKISETTISEEEEAKIIYKNDDIYETDYHQYTRYFTPEYISLLIEKFHFDCFNGPVYQKSQAYVFDTSTGNLLTNTELLKLHHLTLEKLKVKVQEKLTINNQNNEIDITATLNNLDSEDNYGLFINKSGHLTLSYLVKSSQVDYNDSIVLN